MKKIVQNSFGKGLNMDLAPLSTPKDVLTDCINGTVITYNGDEFSLQTELGNTVVLVNSESTEDQTALPHGFIPLGVKEFNNILYIVAHNPLTKESRVGSFPSPRRYLPMHNDETENMVVKTISGTNGDSIQELTENLTTPGYINHGMNLLNAFLNRGDKYQLLIKIGDGSLTWSQSEEILDRFINNYGSDTNKGYFDLSYYTLNIDGNLIPIEVTVTPNDTTQTSDIKYVPDPFNNQAGSVNGKTYKYELDGAGAIIAVLEPKTIAKFDFRLQGYNVGGLKARVVLDPEMIDESNSAIRIVTIKIDVASTESENTSTRYYNYQNEGASEQVIIDQLTNSVSTGFTEGTVLTVKCTPVDQFGRELSSKAVTKTYTVTSVLTGTEAHDLFQYQVVGTTLTVKYNFLNTGDTDITQTYIEFYDFWSGVSKVSAAINFISNKEAEATFTLSSANPKSTTFDTETAGGIPKSTLTLPVAPQRILGTHLTSAALRTDHCYLVRIYGIENSIEYSVFQLLYTGAIDAFTSAWGVVRNFGTIDIAGGLIGQTLDSVVTGSLFGGTPIATESTTPTPESTSSNYTMDGTTTADPYRLYGGPVFEEYGPIENAVWDNDVRFYRNIYTGLFSRDNAAMTSLGYHNLPESTISSLSLVDGSSLSTVLFDSGSKHYLKGGLRPASSNSQKDFKFNIQTTYKAVSPTITGTVSLLPESSGNLLLFGVVDMAVLWKKVKLGNYESDTVINLDKTYTLSNSDISETLLWNVTFSSPIATTRSATARFEVISGETSDTVSVKDFSVSSQRQTFGNSGFKYYNRSYTRNKLFNYFSLSNTQTLKVKLLQYPADYIDITKHIDFMLYGNIDTNYDLQITEAGASSTSKTKYSLIDSASSSFTATLNWVASVNIPTIRQTAGTTVFGLPLNATTITTSSMPQSEKEITILTYPGANAIQQDVYKAYKSPNPIAFRVYTNDESAQLYTYNHIWKWTDVDPYLAVKAEFSDIYLKNLVLTQPYKEIVIAQYPTGAYAYNTANSSTVATLNGNYIEYYIQSTEEDTTKHIVKSCFGTSLLEPITIAKFSNIISNWMSLNSVNVKLAYDFTNVNLSEGLAKNIPWNFGNILLSNIDMANLSMTMKTGSDPAHITLFNNSEATMLASSYMNPTSSSPIIKAISNNSLVQVTTNYFTTESVTATDNINKSTIFVPKFNASGLIGRTAKFLTPEHGIQYKLMESPSLKDIIQGLSLKVGDTFGGGIIIKLDKNSSGQIIGGYIVATEDLPNSQTGTSWWNRLDPPSGCYVAVGATGEAIGDGIPNSNKMKSYCTSKDMIIKQVAECNFGGYTDWFLPSKGEMELLAQLPYSVFSTLGLLLGGNNWYWSSTERHGGNSFDRFFEKAWAHKFSVSGNVPSVVTDYYRKNNPMAARPMRKF